RHAPETRLAHGRAVRPAVGLHVLHRGDGASPREGGPRRRRWRRALRRLRSLLGSGDRQLLRLATEDAPKARRDGPSPRASGGLLVQKPQSPAALAEPGVTLGWRPAIRTRPELLLLPGGAPSKVVWRRVRPCARRVRS